MSSATSGVLLLLGLVVVATASPIVGSAENDDTSRRFLADACDNFCASKSGGLYVNPCDPTCTTFISCANGITFRMNCGPGTVFNPTTLNCDWPYNVVCSASSSPKPRPSPPPPTKYYSPPPPTKYYSPPPPTTKYNSPPPPTTKYNSPPPPTTKYNSPPPPTTKYNSPPPPTTKYYSPPPKYYSPPPPPPAPEPICGPYKDVTINLNWNTYTISSSVSGIRQPITQVMPSGLQVLTWAFATGTCGSETWAGVNPSSLVSANVNAFVAAGKKYIISTGGSVGTFRCETDSGFTTFLSRYYSSSLLGVDFDIEYSMTQYDITSLVQRVKVARSGGLYRNLRYSFTLATFASAPTGNQLNNMGTMVLNAIKAAQMGWNGIYINLMVMDYASNSNCVMSSTTGRCDMGKSAINAAYALNSYWGVPFSSIALVPMIGGNDNTTEIFTLQDVTTVSIFVKQWGLAGVHFWSFDRDCDCPPGPASPTCNSYGQGGTLGFTKAFLSELKEY